MYYVHTKFKHGIKRIGKGIGESVRVSEYSCKSDYVITGGNMIVTVLRAFREIAQHRWK
jgi:hypothetical protein